RQLRRASGVPPSDGEQGSPGTEFALESSFLLEGEGAPKDQRYGPGEESQVAAVSLSGRLAGDGLGPSPRPSEHPDHPRSPPEDLRDLEVGALERGAESLVDVASAMPLDLVELGEEIG